MSENSGTGKKSTHIIVDVGARKKSQIRQLRKGEGALIMEVDQCLQDLRASGKIDGAVQPVILVVREKSKRTRKCPLCMIAGKM
jgi:hypothetical protein